MLCAGPVLHFLEFETLMPVELHKVAFFCFYIVAGVRTDLG
jgi:hypothetical protein